MVRRRGRRHRFRRRVLLGRPDIPQPVGCCHRNHRHEVERAKVFRATLMMRCAIYTRKSSDEGLEQGFNSLDAQREACEAYVLSQVGEGWSSLPTAYDDGGYSGGSVNRPGLQSLLFDIRSGRVDVVVVYKIDRLTRSLADFARIVETFDAHEVSFVSVTQAFNTTSSMGRLTLNVLLSFAQFEREVTGERIRDKIAASKAKGMWMGGLAPLGYDLPANGTRALVVNTVEAETVRHLFQRYLELGSVHGLIAELDEKGIHSKKRTTAKGRVMGGSAFSRGAMFHLLQNRVYVGDIVHKGQRFDGQHDAIVPPELFDAVQTMLADHRRSRLSERRQSSAFVGKLFDASGKRMTPTHSRGASGRTYRYYVSPPSSTAGIRRIPSGAIERFVQQSVTRLLPSVPNPIDTALRVALGDGEVLIDLPVTFERALKRGLDDGEEVIRHACDPQLCQLRLPARLVSRSGGTRIRPTTLERHCRDPVLIKALRTAHSMLDMTRGGAPVIHDVPGPRYQRRLIRLAFLSPSIQTAILAGRQPAGLRLEDVVRNSIPLDWDEQQRWVERLAS